MPDLTPSVRVEGILSGADITPATRLEYFLSKAASEVPKPSVAEAGKVLTVGSDGSYELATAGGGVTPLVETGQPTEEDPTFTSSLTPAQLEAAFNSATPIKIAYNLLVLMCYPAQKSEIAFLNVLKYYFNCYVYDASVGTTYTYSLTYQISNGAISEAELDVYTPS